jgi:N-carbamoyl-L-amino-acid hydrolase
MTHNLTVNSGRIEDDINALAALTEPDRPYTRRAFTPMFLKGRAYLERRFREAGLETRIDPYGNLVGKRRGTGGTGAILLGSHSDTVPNGGRFDGTAGVVVALEVARALSEAGVELRCDLEVIDFLAEEVSIFGVSCIGSRGMVGLRPPEWLGRQADGRTLGEAIREVGGDPAMAGGRSDIKAFLELHIEQGPILEAEAIPIGAVTAIAGITRIEIILEGCAAHAGTTPMSARRDALAAAARLVLGIEELAREIAAGPGHFAATVGEFGMEPNAANVVPSHVRMLIDARAEVSADMTRFQTALAALCAATAGLTQVDIAAPRTVSHNPATPMAPNIVETIERNAAILGLPSRRMASGAGHDAAFIARIASAGMIFVPCRAGRSHTPEEWADFHGITLGAQTAYLSVTELDAELAWFV